jgi:sarcosine oxidase subunit beta
VSEFPSSCDFLIIGAGIAGVSLAAELRRRDVSVCVIEAEQVCSGSSGLNAGGVRQQFSHPTNISLAQRTVRKIEELVEDGHELSYRQVGYLFMIADPKSVVPIQGAIKTQNDLGVPTRWLSPAEVSGMVPGLKDADVLGASFCPTDGYLDPNSFVATLATKARESGAAILSGRSVTGFEHHGERITQVVVDGQHRISVGVVVNCAGAWASGVAKLYGSNLPIEPTRSQLFMIEGAEEVSPDCPVTIDFNNKKTFYHGEVGARLLAGTDDAEECSTSWQVPFEQGKAESLVQRLMHRFTTFDNASIAGGWAGMLEITRDENPIADWTHFSNMYTMAGFSGHGLAIAPSLAEDVAAVVAGDAPSIDLRAFRFERFEEDPDSEIGEAMSMR